jgi:hypothetical protein
VTAPAEFHAHAMSTATPDPNNPEHLFTGETTNAGDKSPRTASPNPDVPSPVGAVRTKGKNSAAKFAAAPYSVDHPALPRTRKVPKKPYAPRSLSSTMDGSSNVASAITSVAPLVAPLPNPPSPSATSISADSNPNQGYDQYSS